MPGMLCKSAAFVPQYQKCRAWRHSDLARILIDAPRPRSSAGALQRHSLRPHRRAAFRSSQATERPWGDKPACADDRKFEEKRTLRCRAAFFDPVASRRMRAFSGMRRLQPGKQATKPWNRSLSTGSRIQVLPAVDRNELRCDPLLCPDRVSRRPAKPPTVARN